MLKIPPLWPVVAVQILLFLVLWYVLKRFWFDPALRVLTARERRSRGAIDEARALEADVARMRTERTAALDQAKADAQREVQDMLRQAEAEQRRLIATATEDAERTLGEARARIAADVRAARESLRGDVQAIAREVARAVVGRTV
jgi:F-type H+-transporting ATPase subunit b